MSAPYLSAFELLQKGDPESIARGLAWLREYSAARPTDLQARFEYAGAFDFLGREAEALPLYEDILSCGFKNLPPEDQPKIFVQLGSTLRNLHRFEESRAVLQDGLYHFPTSGALKAFLALTNYSAGRPDTALAAVFDLLLSTSPDPSIRAYARPLRRYSQNLTPYLKT